MRDAVLFGVEVRVADVPRHEINWAWNMYGGMTLDDVESYEAIAESQADDLIIERPGERVWLARTSRDEGEWCDNKVTVELLIDGRWVEVLEYEAR